MTQRAQLPLHSRHEALGARFSPFAGFDMPMRYGSIIKEHHAVRQNVGLFDVTHMGEVEFHGLQAGEVLNRIVTNDVSRLDLNQAMYTVMCHPSGGIVDDLVVYKLSDARYLVCVNATNQEKDFDYMRQAAGDACDVVNKSDEYVQLALQGPNAEKLLQPITDTPLNDIGVFRARSVKIADVPVLASRTGYTGEDGFELYYATEHAETVFDAIWEAGRAHDLVACGLGARDTLRLEARLHLYGSDVTDDTTPLEAGLGWVVKFKKGDFIGREALLAQRKSGLKRRLRGLILQERGVLRPHYEIFAEQQQVGEITSGGPSPTLGKSIGLGYIHIDYVDEEQVHVDVRNRRLPCTLTKKPFYKRPGA